MLASQTGLYFESPLLEKKEILRSSRVHAVWGTDVGIGLGLGIGDGVGLGSGVGVGLGSESDGGGTSLTNLIFIVKREAP